MPLERSLEEVFTPDELMSAAKDTGFCKRKSKLNPFVFFDLLMYDSSSAKSKSLNQLAVESISAHDISISKQGIDKRFNNQAVDFLKILIEKQLSVELRQQIEPGWLSLFNRVIIKDSTRFEIPEVYKDYLPGTGGSSSKAGACLQFEYDIKGGGITDLSLTAGNKPDNSNASNVLDTIASNDLVIRDLGYFTFRSFSNIMSKGAFFISRLMPKARIYNMKDGVLEELNYKILYDMMKKHGLSRMGKDVLIGNEPKIPVRLIMEILPDEVYAQRMRKSNKCHKRKGRRTSEKFKFLSRFNFIITNVSEDVLPIEVVPALYKIRWQVELIFKIWKSIIGIHHNRAMKYTRWLCLLHFKLLMMIVNWNIILDRRNCMYNQSGGMLSLNKCFKTLFDNSYRLRNALKEGSKGISNFIKWVEKVFKGNHWLERKKKQLGLEKVCYLFYCKSNIYVYI